MRPKKLFLIISTTMVVAFIAIFLSLSPSFIGADATKNGTKDLSSELNLSKGTVTLTKKQQGEKQNFVISRRYLVFQRTLTLTGFEEEANLCADHRIDYPKTPDSVCLTGEVGAHSMNLQIVHLTATSLKAASFSPATGASSDNINSDLPFFSFKDINNDSMIDLAVYNRDYDSDPLQYAIKSYYIRDAGGNYHFYSKERIAYNVNNN